MKLAAGAYELKARATNNAGDCAADDPVMEFRPAICATPVVETVRVTAA